MSNTEKGLRFFINDRRVKPKVMLCYLPIWLILELLGRHLVPNAENKCVDKLSKIFDK